MLLRLQEQRAARAGERWDAVIDANLAAARAFGGKGQWWEQHLAGLRERWAKWADAGAEGEAEATDRLAEELRAKGFFDDVTYG